MAGMTFDIRKAEERDLDALVKNNLAMALETENKNLDAEAVRSGVSAVLDDPAKGFYLVCELDGEIIGQLMITYEWSDWRSADYWWVQSVYVHPDHRHKGAYAELYKRVLAMAEESGACGVRLYVEKGNEAARKAYLVLGMKESDYVMYEADG